MLRVSRASPRLARRHAEVVAVVLDGVVVLGLPMEAALQAIGTSTSEVGADAGRWPTCTR